MEGLPSIEEANLLPPAAAVAAARPLFEASPALEAALAAARPWASWESVIELAERFIAGLLRENKFAEARAVLSAHPAIGADPAKLSADSRAEQGAASDPRVLEKLARLNREYEEKFGFRFVVFVNGRPKEQILEVLEQRIKSDSPQLEMETALKAMMDIARDRLRKKTQKGKL